MYSVPWSSEGHSCECTRWRHGRSSYSIPTTPQIIRCSSVPLFFLFVASLSQNELRESYFLVFLGNFARLIGHVSPCRYPLSWPPQLFKMLCSEMFNSILPLLSLSSSSGTWRRLIVEHLCLLAHFHMMRSGPTFLEWSNFVHDIWHHSILILSVWTVSGRVGASWLRRNSNNIVPKNLSQVNIFLSFCPFEPAGACDLGRLSRTSRELCHCRPLPPSWPFLLVALSLPTSHVRDIFSLILDTCCREY